MLLCTTDMCRQDSKYKHYVLFKIALSKRRKEVLGDPLT